MKKILLFLVFSVSMLFSNTELFTKYYKELQELDVAQINVMSISYFTGKQEDLGYTLAAIAWKESSFGRYTINFEDGKYGSFGPHQIHLYLHVKALGLTSTWEVSREAEKLINNIEYSSSVALKHLLYWKNRSNNKENTYRNMLASYNGGNAGLKNKAAKEYAEDVALRVKVLEHFAKKGYPFKILKK